MPFLQVVCNFLDFTDFLMYMEAADFINRLKWLRPPPKTRNETKRFDSFSSFHEECMFFLTFVDLDECQSPDACGANDFCNNTIGSYRCECANGFVADSGAQDPLNPVCIGKKMDNQKMAEREDSSKVYIRILAHIPKKVTKWNL